MKKKLWQIFLFSALTLLLALTAAAETAVFVRDGGDGDGTSAAAPLGDLGAALNAVQDGGTVVICGPYTIDTKFVAPTNAAPVTITSAYGGQDYRDAEKAALYFANNYFCGGDIDIVNTKTVSASSAISPN
mgnify:CR=1 FL=1